MQQRNFRFSIALVAFLALAACNGEKPRPIGTGNPGDLNANTTSVSFRKDADLTPVISQVPDYYAQFFAQVQPGATIPTSKFDETFFQSFVRRNVTNASSKILITLDFTFPGGASKPSIKGVPIAALTRDEANGKWTSALVQERWITPYVKLGGQTRVAVDVNINVLEGNDGRLGTILADVTKFVAAAGGLGWVASLGNRGVLDEIGTKIDQGVRNMRKQELSDTRQTFIDIAGGERGGLSIDFDDRNGTKISYVLYPIVTASILTGKPIAQEVYPNHRVTVGDTLFQTWSLEAPDANGVSATTVETYLNNEISGFSVNFRSANNELFATTCSQMVSVLVQKRVLAESDVTALLWAAFERNGQSIRTRTQQLQGQPWCMTPRRLELLQRMNISYL